MKSAVERGVVHSLGSESESLEFPSKTAAIAIEVSGSGWRVGGVFGVVTGDVGGAAFLRGGGNGVEVG